VSKQVVGQLFVHTVNLFVSDMGSTRSSGNACVYYFLNILLDTTAGTYLAECLIICDVRPPSRQVSTSSFGPSFS